MANVVWRTLVVIHRYLGVAAGLLMLVWFTSGIVMMYVGFPRLAEAERQRALVPISWTQCCTFGERLIDDTQQVLRAQVEELNGVPVLRVRRAGRPDMAVDLTSGTPMPIDAAAARAIALDAAPRIVGARADILSADVITADQWTVGRHQRDRPLHRFAFDDSARTTLYVSSTTGQIVLWTTAAQRFWNWVGAVPHWLYFTALREDGRLWTEVVIWTSVVGTFLTVFGLYLGIAQFRCGANSRISPYRGLFYWHHLAGLVFGILTLTWVVSGLISMNPWGFLDGRRGGEAAYLAGQAPRWGEVRASLEAIHARAPGAVSLIAAPYAGRLYWLATDHSGQVTRLDSRGAAAPVTTTDLADGAQRIAGDLPIAEQGLMGAEDSYYVARREYYYSRREPLVLPVYRVILNDAERTRYYLDPSTGALLQRADANGRWHRWLFGGLHRLDFFAWMRVRPFWDILVLTLMLGGTAVAFTGVYLALRRIRSDIAVLFRLAGRNRRRSAELPADAPQGLPGRG